MRFNPKDLQEECSSSSASEADEEKEASPSEARRRTDEPEVFTAGHNPPLELGAKRRGLLLRHRHQVRENDPNQISFAGKMKRIGSGLFYGQLLEEKEADNWESSDRDQSPSCGWDPLPTRRHYTKPGNTFGTAFRPASWEGRLKAEYRIPGQIAQSSSL